MLPCKDLISRNLFRFRELFRLPFVELQINNDRPKDFAEHLLCRFIVWGIQNFVGSEDGHLIPVEQTGLITGMEKPRIAVRFRESGQFLHLQI